MHVHIAGGCSVADAAVASIDTGSNQLSVCKDACLADVISHIVLFAACQA
jgi:hypothetical protein